MPFFESFLSRISSKATFLKGTFARAGTDLHSQVLEILGV